MRRLESDTDEGPSRREQRLIHLAFYAVLAIGLWVVGSTYRDYGATWDEGVQARYGELSLQYFESGGRDRSCNDYLNLRFYGPLFEMIPAMAYVGDGPRKYEVRHLFLGLLSVLSLAAVWLYGKSLGGPRVAILGVIAVATLPRLYGHAFNNSKDTSFALTVLWVMAALAGMFGDSRVRWSRTVLCGVAVGLGLCARPGGFPLFGLFVGGAAAVWLVTREKSESAERPWVESRRLLAKLVMVFAIAWAIMVAPWPWAHENVLWNPVEAIRIAAEFPTTVKLLFGGAVISSDRLPWDYLNRYVLIATPLPVLGFAFLGLLLGIRGQVTSWRSRRSRVMTLTQVWLFGPLLLFVLMRPNIHGGMRHFLFVLPALGLLAAYGVSGLLAFVHHPGKRRALWAMAVALLLWPVTDLVRLHPYQVTYFNALVGGVGGASDEYWTDYFLSSYSEAIAWVNERAAASPDEEVEVLIDAGAGVMLWAEHYAAANVELKRVTSRGSSPSSLPADYYIASSRFGSGARFPDAPIVHTIGRDGAIFTVVKGRAGEAPD